MLLQRLATGATGVKQARYRQGPTRAVRHSYAHAQYLYTTLVYVLLTACEFTLRVSSVLWSLALAVHNAWCNACIQCLHMNSAEGFAL